MRAAKVQASLRIRAVSTEPSLLAHTSSEPRGTFRKKARSLAPLSVSACAVKICHDGKLEDTNSFDGAQFSFVFLHLWFKIYGKTSNSSNTKKKKKKISMPVQTIRNYAFGKLHSLFKLIEIKTYRERKITCFVFIYMFGTKKFSKFATLLYNLLLEGKHE